VLNIIEGFWYKKLLMWLIFSRDYALNSLRFSLVPLSFSLSLLYIVVVHFLFFDLLYMMFFLLSSMK
jgi:hypothetical protein